jgi:excisionase family DNA binding protein
MTDDRVPLFVRLPREQASALDRLVDSTGRRKQQLVSDLLADQLAVGRIELIASADADPEAVLTLQEAAELLRLAPETVRASAAAGDLPGRAFGREWRFVRSALLEWLACGGQARPEG